VAVLFLDTSALVRRYDPAEPGAARVRALCRRSSGHTLLIGDITTVEIASALARKQREGSLTQAQVRRLWRAFRLHHREEYQVVALNGEVLRQAERLLFAHPLRAYDALQLATALRARTLLSRITPDFRFCTADQRQATTAAVEGLVVELIQ
jgi:predicted nucleic acid-binding protein